MNKLLLLSFFLPAGVFAAELPREIPMLKTLCRENLCNQLAQPSSHRNKINLVKKWQKQGGPVITPNNEIESALGHLQETQGWNSLQKMHTVKAHTKYIKDALFSRDGKHIITASEDGTIAIIEVDSGKIIHTFQEHTNRVSSLTLNADQSLLISGSSDGTIKIWNLQTLECIKTLKLDRYIYKVLLTNNQKIICLSHKDNTSTVTITIFDAVSYEILHTITLSAQFDAKTELSNDHTQLICCDDRQLKIFDLQSANCIYNITHAQTIKNFIYSNDVVVTHTGHDLYAWDLKTGNELYSAQYDLDEINTIKVTPDQTKIILVCKNQEYRVLDLKTGKRLKKQYCDGVVIKHFVISPCGKQMIVKCFNKIQVFDIASGKCTKIINSEQFLSYSMHAHNNILLIGNMDGFLSIYRSGNWQEIINSLPNENVMYKTKKAFNTLKNFILKPKVLLPTLAVSAIGLGLWRYLKQK